MKSIQWMITGRCNLNCRHCYLNGCPEVGVEMGLERLEIGRASCRERV